MRDVIKFRTIDEYIRLHSGQVAAHLRQLRQVIRKEAPEAEETISYNMPAYKLHGPLVYFAACANHIGFYPTPSAVVTVRPSIISSPKNMWKRCKPLPPPPMKNWCSCRWNRPASSALWAASMNCGKICQNAQRHKT